MIAPLQEKYLDQVLRIEKQSFSVPWTEEMFLLELGAPYSFAWVWLEDDQVFGYLICWLEFEDFHIANLAVSPFVRRQGIARELLMHGLDWALRNEVERALLEVRASNTPARNLYTSLGFKPIAIRRGYYDAPVEDAIILEKRF